MSTALQDAEGVLVPIRRRHFTFAGFGIAAIGAIASMLGNAEPASAGLPSPCCSLASNTRCGTSQCSASCKGGCSHYDCKAGYHRETWYCTAGARTIGCGECVGANSFDCYHGPWYCSIWWDDAPCP